MSDLEIKSRRDALIKFGLFGAVAAAALLAPAFIGANKARADDGDDECSDDCGD